MALWAHKLVDEMQKMRQPVLSHKVEARLLPAFFKLGNLGAVIAKQLPSPSYQLLSLFGLLVDH